MTIANAFRNCILFKTIALVHSNMTGQYYLDYKRKPEQTTQPSKPDIQPTTREKTERQFIIIFQFIFLM